VGRVVGRCQFGMDSHPLARASNYADRIGGERARVARRPGPTSSDTGNRAGATGGAFRVWSAGCELEAAEFAARSSSWPRFAPSRPRRAYAAGGGGSSLDLSPGRHLGRWRGWSNGQCVLRTDVLAWVSRAPWRSPPRSSGRSLLRAERLLSRGPRVRSRRQPRPARSECDGPAGGRAGDPRGRTGGPSWLGSSAGRPRRRRP
jgi:hypothetical protein